jgi:Tc5 transposase DNA-binding domain
VIAILRGRLKPLNAENLANALAGFDDGTYENPNQASKATGTPVNTIYGRLRGRKSRREVNTTNQALTPAEEMALVQWVQRLSATGHPVRHPFLVELAEEIRDQRLKAKDNVVKRPLGQKWVQRFFKRNPPLKSQLAKSMEQARAEVTKEQVLA